MTLISGLLLLLEPKPSAPLSGLTLMSAEIDVQPEERLFASQADHGWQSIVIHDTGMSYGSADSLNNIHASVGKDGLAHHFVINNGTEKQDGLIEIGYRWQRQESGAFLDELAAEDDAELQRIRWFNNNGIGIAVVGDLDRKSMTGKQMDELVWLVKQLQERYSIPATEVYVQVGSGRQGITPRFQEARFRQQLLRINTQASTE
ncbi:N-acetylmuramoyl-L-alanine amidase [Planctomycetota bacterium]|nr:N-acetylmuramoyl-L-alanine amidase [Planctomycetota bacterium]